MTCKNGHSLITYNCRACKELLNKWYEKAKRSGFIDIEKDNQQLKDHGAVYTLRRMKDAHTTGAMEAKLQYYLWASEMFEKGHFQSKKDKQVWKYHVNGLSRREIQPKVKLEGSWISRKIRKIGKYLKNQEN